MVGMNAASDDKPAGRTHSRGQDRRLSPASGQLALLDAKIFIVCILRASKHIERLKSSPDVENTAVGIAAESRKWLDST